MIRWTPRSTHAGAGRARLHAVPTVDRSIDLLEDLRLREFAPEAARYFNAAGKGPIPALARRYVDEALAGEERPWDGDPSHEPRHMGALRASFGQLIGAPGVEIAVATSTSEIVGKCAAGLRIPKGGRVACIRGEFPSNVNAWLVRGETDGTPVDFLEPPGAAPDANWLAERLRPGTAALTISWIAFSTGARADAAAIGALCKERGIFFILDATQGVGAAPFDASAVPFDVLACSAYKWLLGPYGIAFGCFRPSAHDRLETVCPSWRSGATGADYTHLTDYTAEMMPGGVRFDRGEATSPLVTMPARAGMETLLAAGVETIHAHAEGLIARFAAGLDRARWAFATPLEADRRGTILCVRPKRESPENAFARIGRAGFAVSLREGAIRVSFHLFNTAEAVDALLAAMRGA